MVGIGLVVICKLCFALNLRQTDNGPRGHLFSMVFQSHSKVVKYVGINMSVL